MTLRAESRHRMTWAERVQKAYDAWHRWHFVPGRFRMDRVLKESGTRDLIVERDHLQTQLIQLVQAVNEERRWATETAQHTEARDVLYTLAESLEDEWRDR